MLDFNKIEEASVQTIFSLPDDLKEIEPISTLPVKFLHKKQEFW